MRARILAGACLLICATATASAAEVELNAVFYPDGKKLPVSFETTDRAPKAVLKGEVLFENGQAKITITWSKLEPALLFGGDMNCWVLWSITPDGLAESLGELPVREDRSGKGTGRRRPSLAFCLNRRPTRWRRTASSVIRTSARYTWPPSSNRSPR